MGADDDACCAAGDLVADLPLLLRRHRPCQQRDTRGRLLAAELTRHGQRTEHVADGPGMLGGKHFRGRQQRALIAGVDHLQHGEHRDDGLARADLALQHPVHGLGVGEFGRTARRARRAGPPSARTAAVCTTRRPGHPSRGGAGGPVSLSAPCLRSTSAHCRPTASSKASRSRARSRSSARSARWIARSASSSEHQIPLPQNAFRQRILDRVEHVEHLAHARVDVPALHLGAGRVDREEVPLERREQVVLVARRLSAIFASDLRALALARSVENQERRVRQLHCALEEPDLRRTASAGCPRRGLLQGTSALKNVAVTLGLRLPSVMTRILPLPLPVGRASACHPR